LDCSHNPIVIVEDFTDKVFELLPNLEVLNGFDKEGNAVSDDDMDFGEGEGGEEDMDEEEYFAQIKANLTDEERKEIEDKGLTMQQYLDSNPADLDFNSDASEDEEESEGEGKANKRAKN